MLHEEITKDIIGAAMAVLNELKPGLDEKLYENALVIELAAGGHTVNYRLMPWARTVQKLTVVSRNMSE